MLPASTEIYSTAATSAANLTAPTCAGSPTMCAGHWQRAAVPAAASSSTQLNALSWIPGGTSVWAGGASFPDSNPNGISQAAFLKYGP